MNIKLTQTLPKTHTQKILKKEAKSKNDKITKSVPLISIKAIKKQQNNQ